MRISNTQLFTHPLNRLLDLQRNVAEVQNQISTGKRISRPGDDPVAATAVNQLNERLDALRQYDRNGTQLEQRLNQVDDVLNGFSSTLQRVRELVLQGRNESLGNVDRQAIAIEIREHIDSLVELGNSRNASGEHLFAGASVDVPPFVRAADGSVSYNGDQTVRRIQISESRSVEESFAGDRAFFAIRNGNGGFVTGLAAGNTGTAQISDNAITDPSAFLAHNYRVSFTSPTTYDVINDTLGTTVLAAQTYVDGAAITFDGQTMTLFGQAATGDQFTVQPSANQSMFATLNQVAATLDSGKATPSEAARFGFDMDRGIEGLDRAVERVNELRATTGARINSLEAQRELHLDLNINMQSLRSSLEDVDLTEAISILAQETTALEAAQATFVRVQGLSLFNFL